jgi:hypothetical protein
MWRPSSYSVVLSVVFVGALLGATVFALQIAWSQTRVPTHTPSPSFRTPSPQLPSTSPSLQAPIAAPSIQTPSSAPSTETPSASRAPNVQVVPPPRRIEGNSPECEVRELQCTGNCYPLPGQWPSHRMCLQEHCKQVSTNCLEKLAEILDRQAADEETTITFRVQNTYRYWAQVVFYSQNRNAAWPGSDRAYDLKDSSIRRFHLRCRVGERICYGGWVTGGQRPHWGVGLNNRDNCTDCCWSCAPVETPPIILR